MKILVSVDIEGIAGVLNREQTRAGNPEYERARRWMTAEADAAVRGAFDGGADEVVVNDSHGGYANLLPDQLDARAQVLLGKPRRLGMMAGVEGAAGVLMVGWHARAGSAGVLAHTINSGAFGRIWLGGEELGEAGLYAALAGEHGAPVLLASGCDAFAAQTQPLLPGARFVVVKQAGGASSGCSWTPARACEAIATASAAVVRAARDGNAPAPLRLALPGECRLQCLSTAHADLFALLPQLDRIDALTLRFDAPDAGHALRMLNAISAMALSLR